MKKLIDKVIAAVKSAAGNRVVRNVCVVALIVHCVLLVPMVLANLFDPLRTGLLLVTVCLVLDMVPDAFVDNGGKDDTEEGADT